MLMIGLPVFDGERFLPEAVESLLSQTYRDFRLVIADNCSTDSTATIAQGYERADDRVSYVRRERNIGASANYNELARAADTTYFKWAASDDIHAPTFLERCMAALEENDSAIGAYPRATRVNERSEIVDFENYRLKTAAREPHVRFRAIVSQTHSCFSIFGVFRTSSLRRTQLIRTHHGGDRVLLAELALQGQIVETPAYLLSRRLHEASFSSSTSIDDDERARFWSGEDFDDPDPSPTTAVVDQPLEDVYRTLIDASDLAPADRHRCERELRLRAARKLVRHRIVNPLRREVMRRRSA